VKLRDDPNPAQRPAAREVALTTGARIGFEVLRGTDRGDRV